MPSEKQQRTLRQLWSPDCLEAETALFSFTQNKETALKPAACIFVPDLWHCISSILDDLQEYDTSYTLLHAIAATVYSLLLQGQSPHLA